MANVVSIPSITGILISINTIKKGFSSVFYNKISNASQPLNALAVSTLLYFNKRFYNPKILKLVSSTIKILVNLQKIFAYVINVYV